MLIGLNPLRSTSSGALIFTLLNHPKYMLAIAASVIILAASITPNLVYATSLTDMFCAAYRLGLAQSSQQSVMWGLLGSGQLLSQYQQNQQQGVYQNPCPSGTQLVGLQCQVINGLNSAATTAQFCQTQNAVLTHHLMKSSITIS